MVDFDRLNRETWRANNIGNQHHPINTGIHHPVDFNAKNRETYASNNGIRVSDMYERMGCPWKY